MSSRAMGAHPGENVTSRRLDDCPEQALQQPEAVTSRPAPPDAAEPEAARAATQEISEITELHAAEPETAEPEPEVPEPAEPEPEPAVAEPAVAEPAVAEHPSRLPAVAGLIVGLLLALIVTGLVLRLNQVSDPRPDGRNTFGGDGTAAVGG